MTKKMKRYDGEEGSVVTNDELEAANKTDDPIQALNRTKKWTDTGDEDSTSSGTKAAESEVEPGWTTTKTVTVEKKPSKPAIVTPAQIKAAGFDNLRDYLNDKQGFTRRGSAGQKGPGFGEADAYYAKQTAAKKASDQEKFVNDQAYSATSVGKQANAKRNASRAESEALEESHPEDVIFGIAKAPAKAAVSGLRSLATKGVDEAVYLGKSGKTLIKPDAERLADVVARRITQEPKKLSGQTRQLSGPKRVVQEEADTDIPFAGREAATNKSAWMAGPRGAKNFKQGGKVKAFAQGGSVSASNRGDGIASKGKTRGRMC